MTTTDQTIQFRSALLIENCTHEEYYRVLDMVLRLFSSAGFHMKTIHCNCEFWAMMDKVKDDLGVCMSPGSCTRGGEEQQNYQGAGTGGIPLLLYKALPR
jgi:hypothetical protein